MSAKITPSQTIGPFFAYGLTAEQYRYTFDQIATAHMAHDTTKGERITITGRVLDAHGIAIDDAMVEFFQANGNGVYATAQNNTGFNGFGRVGTGTDPQNRFIFHTIKPGSVSGHAPHITVTIFARGMLNHQYTRIYFADEDNSTDPVLKLVPADRQHTLIAQKTDSGYQFDIVLQGENETVFFDL